MSAAFREIQNIVRTYQRQLRLPDTSKPASADRAEPVDRLTISDEARGREHDTSGGASKTIPSGKTRR